MHIPPHLSSSVLVQHVYKLQSFHLLEQPKNPLNSWLELIPIQSKRTVTLKNLFCHKQVLFFKDRKLSSNPGATAIYMKFDDYFT